MPWWGWLLVAVIALAVADRFLLAAESRHWINYRRTQARRGTASRAALSLQQVFEPDKAHIVEQQQSDDADIDRPASGAPPKTEEQ